MKKLFTAALSILCAATLASAKPEISASGSVELYGNYLWRGSQVCGAHLLPYGEVNIGNFKIDGCGYITFDNSYSEIDVEISYTIKDFTLMLSDYYNPVNDYFNWNKGESGHALDLQLKYDSSLIPFRASWSTMIFGDEYLKDDGNNSFSSYLELQGYHSFDEFGELSLTAGFNVFKSVYTGFKNSFAPIHLELKYSNSIEAGSFSFPLSVSYMVNPYDKLGFINASVGIAF